jgi:putative ABC transport system permease protein
VAALHGRVAEDRTRGAADGVSRLRRLFHLRESRPPVEAGVDWELDHHLAERVDELVAGGLDEAAAREHALRSFGDVDRVRRELRRLDTRNDRRRSLMRMLDELRQDVRFGVRGIGRHPGLAAGVVLTLALGIGANSALFSVVDALLLRPLPYHAPEELVDVWTSTPQREYATPIVAHAVARGWHEAHEGAALLHSRASALYTGGLEPSTLAVQAVTPDFVDVLGVAPARGRGLLPEDAEPGAADVALIDHAFWQTQLGGDPDVLGTTIMLNAQPYIVVGIMPARFRFPTYSTTAAWVALRADGTMLGRPARNIEAVARVPVEQRAAVAAQTAALGAALFREANPASEQTLRLRAIDWRRTAIEDINRAMLLLTGAVVLILLVAGVNMVNLLLARGATREDEIAVRLAMGASRGRIVRQIGTEAMLLALLGGAAAVFVALLIVRSLQGILPGAITFWAPYDIIVEQRTLVFTFLITVASGLVFGLLPALSAGRWIRPASAGGLTRYATRTPAKRRLRRGLVVSEVAFSVTLLITAALLINSFARLMRVESGIRLDELAVAVFDVSSASYPTAESQGAYLRRLEERITAIPGVASATISGGIPPRGGGMMFGVVFEPEGAPPQPMEDGRMLPTTSVAPNFFEVTGARLLQGRTFDHAENAASGAVIIDAALARHLWPGESALGRRFRMRPDGDWHTVVGVSAELGLMGPLEQRADFAVLFPLGNYDGTARYLTMAVRTVGDPRRALPAIRAAIREVDPNQPIDQLVTARSYYADAVDMPRFLATMIGTLAALALTLAAVGIHGVLAFGVAQRRHELGVRMVLGARAGSLGRLVVGEGLALAAAGTALGVAGALLATRVVHGALHGVDPVDLPTYAVVVAMVTLVAAAATVRPAARAIRLDPNEVLRSS